MSDNRPLLDALSKPFPREAIKQRRAGNSSKALDYVEGYTIIRRLNAATDGQWSWQIKSFEFRPLPKTSNGNEQSLVVVTGELTIPGLGTRAGIGVQKVTESGGEDLVKGASTDALKKAATLFGVALELYGEDYEAEDTLAPVLDLLAEMDSSKRPWAEIKRYADDQGDKLGGEAKARIHDALKAIAGRRKAAAPAAPPSH